MVKVTKGDIMPITWKWGISILNGQEITKEISLDMEGAEPLIPGENQFAFSRNMVQTENNVSTCSCCFKMEKGNISHGRLFLAAELPAYRDDWFIFIPSACYDGNCFSMVDVNSYPPCFFRDHIPRDAMDPGVVGKEVPSLHNGFNRQITDASAPLIGIFMPEKKQTFFLALEQDTILGNNGIELAVTKERNLQILLSFPSCRRKTFCACKNLDTAPALTAGLEVSIAFQTRIMETEDIVSFYKSFAEIRNLFPEQGAFRHYRSLSHAEEILLKMFEEDRFLKEYGFYTKARGQKVLELGWVAGQEYSAIFANGSENAKRQVMTQLEMIFANAQLESGFFTSLASVKEDNKIYWKTINFPPVEGKNTCIVRFECEMLFFLIKLLRLLDERNVTYPDRWKASLYKLAKALEKFYLTYGQFGNIMEPHTGNLVLGGSGNGMLGPGAMALAAEYFREESFLAVAMDAAGNYVKDLRKKGYTYGGPGDAMNMPDSESAFSLLESLVTLAEVDEKNRAEWLQQAQFAADYCASWVPAVAYKFPKDSTFDRLGLDCRGAVQANLQNQHGAPAACINSSSAFFRLFRMTGEKRFLEILREIVHNCVQYISTENTPITAYDGRPLPVGDICEKVFFQDYVKRQGEIFCASGGWTEIAVLLTVTENPGIYCDTEKDFLFVMDHIDAQMQGDLLTVSNPFDYSISVRVFVEKEGGKTYDFQPFPSFKKITLQGKEKKSFSIKSL